MANSRAGGPRFMPAGSEFDDDLYDENPFDDGSDNEELGIRVSQVAQNSTPSTGCTWGMITEEGTEEDVLFGRKRDPNKAGWDLPAEWNIKTGVGSRFGLLRDREEESEEDSSDPIPDRELKRFLRSFAIKDAYKTLHEGNINLKKLLKMGESDFVEAGFGGDEKLPLRRHLMYAISETHKFEWIPHEALAVINGYVATTRRLTNPVVLRTLSSASERSLANPAVLQISSSALEDGLTNPAIPRTTSSAPEDSLINPFVPPILSSAPEDGPANLNEFKQQVSRSMGSVCQQVVSTKQLLGFIAASAGFLKELTETAVDKGNALEEDVQETRMNAADIAAAVAGLRQHLLHLRKCFFSPQTLQ